MLDSAYPGGEFGEGGELADGTSSDWEGTILPGTAQGIESFCYGKVLSKTF